MIRIHIKRFEKQVELKMPILYEELELALWKLGLERAPEKYSLNELNAVFQYDNTTDHTIVSLINIRMSLLDAVRTIYTAAAPPAPLLEPMFKLLSSGKTISAKELETEKARMIADRAKYVSTCYYPIMGVLVDSEGNTEEAPWQLMLEYSGMIKNTIQNFQSWLLHDAAICFSDTETDAEETMFQKILSATWMAEKHGVSLVGRIVLLLTDTPTEKEMEALEQMTRRITTQDMALRADRWSVLTDQGLLYIHFGTADTKVLTGVVEEAGGNMDDSDPLLCPECEAMFREKNHETQPQESDVEWLDILLRGSHTIPHPREWESEDE